MKINPQNVLLVREFLDNKIELSDATKYTYTYALKKFCNWVAEYLDNKLIFDIKKKDFVRYLNYLTNEGLSEAAIRCDKSAVSSLCKYLEMMYEDEYPMFRPFVTSAMKVIRTGNVREKVPLTPDEIENLCKILEDKKMYEHLAYVRFAYSTGCRRGEAHQLLKEVINYAPLEKVITYVDENGVQHNGVSRMYKTHKIRCKGASKVGKIRELKFDQQAMDAIKKWLEVRGEDDCPYVFTTGRGQYLRQACPATFNTWCREVLSPLVGRRVHPHLFRESRATNLVVYEHRSSKVAQKLLGHESVATTEGYYIINPDAQDESDEAFLAM